jgi:tRNA-dihydrouridine synthase A
MADPGLVADCIAAMSEAVDLPVTLKHRIGIDDMDSYEQLTRFVAAVSQTGCSSFIVHARKAWLQGLSPKQNREIPPLQYDVVHRLKQDFPQLDIIINGGFKTLAQIQEQLGHVDGVMVGREAYQNPWILAQADKRIFGATEAVQSRPQVVEMMLPYIEQQRRLGVPIHRITRHMLGLFQGQPGARAWRRHLSENVHRTGTGPEILCEALALVR